MHSGARPFEDTTEIARFLAAIDGTFKLRDRALVTLGLYAGLRVASALSLKIGDVFDGHRFRRSIRVARKSMKGRSASFVIPLHPKAARAIARWLVELRRRGIALDAELPIFLSRQQGRAMTTRAAGMMISNAARRAGLDDGILSHSWRKTFAMRLYEGSGHCLLTVGAALAHSPSDVRTTARYLRFRITERANAAVLDL